MSHSWSVSATISWTWELTLDLTAHTHSVVEDASISRWFSDGHFGTSVHGEGGLRISTTQVLYLSTCCHGLTSLSCDVRTILILIGLQATHVQHVAVLAIVLSCLKFVKFIYIHK